VEILGRRLVQAIARRRFAAILAVLGNLVFQPFDFCFQSLD